ncbi:MAG: acyl carrier protein [Rhodobacteraceae bacterium]|nr:acyl carrier protein [Paracoccaceae bacterium]
MTEQSADAATFTDEDIEAKVIEIVASHSLNDSQEVTLASTPQDLSIDSLGLVEIIFSIEETFDVSVPYNANDPSSSDFDISTVGAVVAGVKRLIANQRAA